MLRMITAAMCVAYSLVATTHLSPEDWRFWAYWMIAMVGVAVAGWELGVASRARKEPEKLKEDTYHEPDPNEGLVMITPIATAALLPADPEADKDASIRAALSMALMDASQMGIKKYGTPLFSHNGRNARRDATQELVDLLQYAIQNNIERGEVDWTLLRAIEILPEILLRADEVCATHGLYEVVDREDAHLKLRNVLHESRNTIRSAQQNVKRARAGGDRVDTGATDNHAAGSGHSTDCSDDGEDSEHNGGGTIH